jgi:hypothetical protein
MPNHTPDTGSSSTHPAKLQPAAVISILELYGVEELKARLRWTDSSLRAAKRRGLQLLKCGKRRYATGKEVIRFLESQK